MNNKIGVLGVLLGLLFLPLTSVSAQYCNPAVVDYIVRDENGEIIPAGVFIPIIEELGLVRLIDRYVLDTLMADLVGKAHRAEAKVILVGDPKQLPSIEAGGLLAGRVTDHFVHVGMQRVGERRAAALPAEPGRVQLSARHRAVDAIEICRKLQMLQDTTRECLPLRCCQI